MLSGGTEGPVRQGQASCFPPLDGRLMIMDDGWTGG